MNLTKREREMEAAQKRGQNAWPHGKCPEEYRLSENAHCKVAWEAGYAQARNSYYSYYG